VSESDICISPVIFVPRIKKQQRRVYLTSHVCAKNKIHLSVTKVTWLSSLLSMLSSCNVIYVVFMTQMSVLKYLPGR